MGDHENDDPNTDLEEDTAATQNKKDDGQSKLSREERKILQKSYKGLYDQTVDLQDVELQDLDRDEFKRIVKTSNRLFKKVDGTQEALLDAKVFKNLTRISKNLIEQVSTATKFSVLDFADKLITYFNVDTQNNEGIFSHHFQKLGKENQHVATSTPYIRFLYGSLEREENTVIIEKKKERQKKVRGDEAGLATQTMIDDGTGNSAEEVSGSSLTEMLVESTMQQLKINFENNEREPISYFNFILDPSSFGNSVENMFHVSFLIKEGRAKMIIDDDDDLPKIRPINPKKDGSKDGKNQGPDCKNQSILALTYKDWEELCDAFNVQEAMIHHDKTFSKNLKKARR